MNDETGQGLQLDEAGRLRHLLTLDGLAREELEPLLDLAQFYVRLPGDLPARDASLYGRTVANLFFEPSTRTRVSFELAASRLGATVVNLEMQSSSRVKGETVLDTLYTLEAMQVDVFVIRDAEPGIPAFVTRHVAPQVSVLNAGEAHVSHPTQGLLDALTIRQRKGAFGSLCVAIVGDVKHSRVARSTYRALTTLGIGELRIVAPEALMPAAGDFPGARRCTTLAEGLRGADVVMALRIQHERIAEAHMVDAAGYRREFGLTAEHMQLAAPDAIVMHPGPMNRGVEISDEVADGPRSCIRLQVSNGVAVRMAVLSTIVRNGQLRNIEAARTRR